MYRFSLSPALWSCFKPIALFHEASPDPLRFYFHATMQWLLSKIVYLSLIKQRSDFKWQSSASGGWCGQQLPLYESVLDVLRGPKHNWSSHYSFQLNVSNDDWRLLAAFNLMLRVPICHSSLSSESSFAE